MNVHWKIGSRNSSLIMIQITFSIQYIRLQIEKILELRNFLNGEELVCLKVCMDSSLELRFARHVTVHDMRL